MPKLLECVPNFSEGRDADVIRQITDEIEKVSGAKLLNVDPGASTNRTVVTFVGTPDAVIEAAFQAIKKASQVIDMRKHKGEHPRMGATDVCPLVPINPEISTEEAVKYSKKLAKRVADELNIPVYLYEYSATKPERKSLAHIRAGEYEGFFDKIKLPEWKPDFGKAEMNAKSGATVIGVREFLVAYNVNLNTKSVRLANAVAFDIREAGRVKKNSPAFGGAGKGETEKDASGNPIRIPGALKECRAIGWFIDEYGIAQVSINLTNLKITPVHKCFEEAVKSAEKRGLRVTGSELVGLIPKQAMTEAGKYFLAKQKRSQGVSEEELIHIAVRSLGLNDISPFEPRKKIIEYLLEENKTMLIQKTVREFHNELASESPAPGGGSTAALAGALGASLGTMVANLTAGKNPEDSGEKLFSKMNDWAVKGQQWKDELLSLVDKDTEAFNELMKAFRLPKKTEEEKSHREKSVEEATKNAMLVPYRVMEISREAMNLAKAMAEEGNPNSVSDAGVGALCLRTAARGAYLNIKINAGGLKGKKFSDDLLKRAEKILNEMEKAESEIMKIVDKKISS